MASVATFNVQYTVHVVLVIKDNIIHNTLCIIHNNYIYYAIAFFLLPSQKVNAIEC